MIVHFLLCILPKLFCAFFRALSSPRGVLDFVIMARNLEQNNEIAELSLKGQYHGRYHDFGQKFTKFKL